MSHETEMLDQAEKMARARKTLAEAQLAEEKVRRANGETGDAKFFGLLGIAIMAFGIMPMLAATAFPMAALMGLAFFVTGASLIKKAWDVSPAVHTKKAARSAGSVEEEQVVYDQPQQSDVYARFAGRTGSEVVPTEKATDAEIFQLHRELDHQLEKLQTEFAR